MSVSLYRKYRPQNFSDVTGQKAAIEVLTNSILKDRVGHAYLFSGSRGCGKTSVARIFAKALNCLDRQKGFEPCGACDNCKAITAGESLDVIEIDGASNNGVENIRGLKENVTLAPFSSKYKIYIIDEVHMLSQGAFNALLKTLEEPPEYVIFIMATTEPNRVPVTIRSRCQHIPFHSISPEDIFKRLEFVCQNENLSAESEALWEISRQADGALRDALSLLEQVTAAGDVTLSNVENIFGAGSRPAFERWLKTLREDPGQAYLNLKAMFDAGASSVRVFEEMFSLVKNLWLVSKWENINSSLGISEHEQKFLHDEAKNWTTEKIFNLLQIILRVLTQARLGVKNDILIGMFMLYFENPSASAPVQVPSPVIMNAPSPLNIAPAPAAQQSKAPEVLTAANQVEFDPAFKDSLLNQAHEKNFLVFCGLFDARPYERGQDLILDLEHKYNYEVLRQDRNSVALSEIFNNYSSVILKYSTAETFCAKTQAQAQAQASWPEPVFIPKESQELQAEVKEVKKESSSSPFAKICREFANLGAKPEVILMTREESQEEIESEAAAEIETEGDD